MRVDSLIELLESFPSDYQVYIDTETSKLEISEETDTSMLVQKVIDINNLD